MKNLGLLKEDIEDILIEYGLNIELIGEYVLIHKENADFFEEILEKDCVFIHYDNDSGIPSLDITRITQEDILTLKDCLDYLYVI